MNVVHIILLALVLICLLSSGALAYDTSFSKFPKDPAALPSRLENMRPGQIRDAVAQNAPVILPIGTIESVGDDSVLGVDLKQGEESLMAFAKAKNAVIAPTIWYGPNGYILGSPADGTVDVPIEAFSAYVKEVLLSLTKTGFKSVLIVPLHNPQGGASSETPMISACTFAIGDVFNDYWKDPSFGAGWWDKPGAVEKLPWHPYQIVEMPMVQSTAATTEALPLRLENMTPLQVKKAVADGLPLFLPVGVLETHGNHNPVGVDAFEAQDYLLLAAAKQPAVIAPTIWYGPTASACGEPKLGDIDMNGVAWQHYIDGVITGLAELGFKSLTVVQCHQGGGAERQGINMAIQQYRARLAQRPGYGPGWAKRLKPEQMNHCQMELVGPPQMPSDHAGKNETTNMLATRAQYTNLSLLKLNDYLYCWTKDDESIKATPEYADEVRARVVKAWTELIQAKTKP